MNHVRVMALTVVSFLAPAFSAMATPLDDYFPDPVLKHNMIQQAEDQYNNLMEGAKNPYRPAAQRTPEINAAARIKECFSDSHD